MANYRFFTGLVVVGITVCTSVLAKAAIALPLPSPSVPKAEPTARVEPNTPLCYVQFQGSSTIDVSRVCGKKPGETPANAVTVSLSKTVMPPVFDPKAVNASTTGQCNFVDANGKPCPQVQP